jgi:hypothetical protein
MWNCTSNISTKRLIIEKLTGYFVFPNVKRTLRDLLEMEAKVPSDVEWDVRVRGECDRQKTT